MKWVWLILGGLIGVLVLAVLGLWAAGFRKSTGKVTASVEVNRPVAHVWRYLTDDAKVKSWVGGLLEIRPEAGTPSGVGWRARMVVAMGKQRFEGDWETTAFEEHKRIGFVMKSPPSAGDGFVETGDYHVEESGGRTRVTLATTLPVRGLVPAPDGAGHQRLRAEQTQWRPATLEDAG